MFHVMRYHCRQLFSSRRWLFVLVIDAFLALAVVLYRNERLSYLITRYHIVPPAANIWDVPVEMLCANFIMIFILMTAFVFLVGDVFLRDERTGRLPMLLSRTRTRATWFVSLIPAVFLAAVAFVATAIAVSLIVALLFLPAGRSFSPFLTGSANLIRGIAMRNYNFLPDMSLTPPMFFAGVILYLAPALCCIALLGVVISIWWRQTIAVFIPVVWIVVDILLKSGVTRYSPGIDRFMFSSQLMLTQHWESADSLTVAALYPFPVAASVIAFVVLLLLWATLGLFSFRSVDL